MHTSSNLSILPPQGQIKSAPAAANCFAAHAPKTTESYLLFRHLPKQDDRRLQSLLARHGLTPIKSTAQELAADGPITQSFQSDTHSLTFTQSATPRSAADFEGALRSPYLGAYRGMMSAMIERHESYMCFSLTLRGDAPHSTKSYIDQLCLLHALTRAIARATAPMALYWSASSQILTGAQYSALTGVDAPWALFVQPIPQAAGTDRDGRPLTALRLEGAAHFLGSEVALAPSALPRADILRLCLGFVQYCAERGTMIKPGESLGKTQEMRVERGPATDRIDLIARVSHRYLPPAPKAAKFSTTPRRWRAAFVAAGAVSASLALAVGITFVSSNARASAQSFAAGEITTSVLPPHY